MPGHKVKQVEWLTEYDAYYTARHGAKWLPMLRVRFGRSQKTARGSLFGAYLRDLPGHVAPGALALSRATFAGFPAALQVPSPVRHCGVVPRGRRHGAVRHVRLDWVEAVAQGLARLAASGAGGAARVGVGDAAGGAWCFGRLNVTARTSVVALTGTRCSRLRSVRRADRVKSPRRSVRQAAHRLVPVSRSAVRRFVLSSSSPALRADATSVGVQSTHHNAL